MSRYTLPDFGPTEDLAADPPLPFEPVSPAEVPPGLAAAAAEALVAFARRTGGAPEVAISIPRCAARARGFGRAMGEPVIALDTWRVVCELVLGGLPGLLVAEVTAIEDESAADALARCGPDVYFVPFATCAERIALAPRPGFALPRPR